MTKQGQKFGNMIMNAAIGSASHWVLNTVCTVHAHTTNSAHVSV